MSRSELLPIYRETYLLVQEILRATVKFPKEHKFTLGQQLNADAVDLLRLIFRANHAKDKSEELSTFLEYLERVRVGLRLCANFKILSAAKQTHLAELLDMVAKQGSAWQKSESRKKGR